MPLHLLGKKSWNVYNAASIARVKADEEAAAVREAAADQRMQDLDAERRAALLRGRTPPPLPEEDSHDADWHRSRHGRHDGKRRRLRGEDDTDADMRLAASMTKPHNGTAEDAKILKLRDPSSDAPLTNHAGNIDLFPVGANEAIKREKNAEAEKGKDSRQQALEDQHTMRFSNAAGRNGLDQPWYAAQQKSTQSPDASTAALDYPGFESKNVWGNEDPRRKQREHARIASNDPFAFMQKAQTQLVKSKEDRKKWADERRRELIELQDTQMRKEKNKPHKKSCHRRSQSPSPNRESRRRHSHRRDRSRSRSRDRDRKDGYGRHSSSRHHKNRSPSGRGRRDRDQRFAT